MSRWNLPPWVSLALAVAVPTAVGTWRVQATKTALETAQTEMRTATMARLDALYYEVCSIRQAIEAKSLSKVCGSDGRPDLQPVVSRYFAGVPEPAGTPYLLAYGAIGACGLAAVCIILSARFGPWAVPRQMEKRLQDMETRVRKLEEWRDADPTVPPDNPDERQVDCA